MAFEDAPGAEVSAPYGRKKSKQAIRVAFLHWRARDQAELVEECESGAGKMPVPVAIRPAYRPGNPAEVKNFTGPLRICGSGPAGAGLRCPR